MQSTCPNCGRYYTHQLKDTWLIVCSHCSHQISNCEIKDTGAFLMPDDFSSIQIGTTGIYKMQSFIITGRIRFQMKDDFRNLWCAKYGDKTIWIGQSLESVGFFTPPFAPYPYEFEGLRAGVFVKFTKDIKLKCEMVDPCVDMKFEGEISEFPFPNAKVTVIQGSNSSGNTVLLFSNNAGRFHFLWGELMLVYGYKFDNVRQWTEWSAK